MVKNMPANGGDIRDVGSIAGSGRSPGGGNGNPLQYSCLENPMDKGAWWAMVYRVTKSWIQVKRLSSSSSMTIYAGKRRMECSHSYIYLFAIYRNIF